MLKYSYKLQINPDKEDIVLDDIYVSKNLSFISGTTVMENPLSIGERVYVYSDFTEGATIVDITNVQTVKRNGYIEYPLSLKIKYAQFVNNVDNELIYESVAYVEYNGDIIYQKRGDNSYLNFKVNGKISKVPYGEQYVSVNARSYVEDDTVLINGVLYNVLINDNDSLIGETGVTFTDMDGIAYSNSQWDCSSVTKKYNYVQKVEFGNVNENFYEIKSIDKFGYIPYIVYNGDKLYLENLYNEDEHIAYAVGVIIDDENYEAVTIPENDYSFNMYNKLNYVDSDGQTGMSINGEQYTIYFEYDTVSVSDLLCLETTEEHPSILYNEKIKLSTEELIDKLYFVNEDDGHSYIYANESRYEKTANLCDEVLINDLPYRLSYSGDSANPEIGMNASCVVDDGDVVYFQVTEVSNNKVQKLKRIKLLDDAWVDSYSLIITDSSGKSEYKIADNYTINHYDGVQIGEDILKVYSEENDGETLEYVTNYHPDTYTLRVVDVIGNNKLICNLEINKSEYTNEMYSSIVYSEIEDIIGTTTGKIIQESKIYGDTYIDAKRWLPRLRNYSGSTSVYEIMDLPSTTTILRQTRFNKLRINLVKNVDNSMNKSNLITSYYYDEKADATINKLVDLDKDIYTPVYKAENGKNRYIDRMIFNFHFRTRDMETWEINKDDGDLSVNKPFTNWFVTDYYPYNQTLMPNTTISQYKISNMMNRSDLLGFLYFTTDDVKTSRKKLTGSFLRITFYDSKNPNKQNMLGTSTIFLDYERYFKVIYNEDYVKNPSGTSLDFFTVKESYNSDWFNSGANPIYKIPEVKIKEGFNVPTNSAVTVLTECYDKTTSDYEPVDNIITYVGSSSLYKTEDEDGYLPRLDSRIVVSNRYLTGTSSEGFYSYILKTFGDKTKEKTIYMKMEFFHAGVGIKIPMVIATNNISGSTNYKNAIKDSEWDEENLKAFENGYNLDEIYDRLYVPITISYDDNLHEFVFKISEKNGFYDALVHGSDIIFNLFELKTKAQ